MTEETMSNVYLLDTSAWLTLIEDEDGSDIVRNLITRAATSEVTLLTSFMSFMEVRYISLQEVGEEATAIRLSLMESLPVLCLESSKSLGTIAAIVKARHRHSLADAWIVATALENNAILVHKDPEFEQMVSLVKFTKLLYKR